MDGSQNCLKSVRHVIQLAENFQLKIWIRLINELEDTLLNIVKRYVLGYVLKDYFIEMGQRDLKPAVKILKRRDKFNHHGD